MSDLESARLRHLLVHLCDLFLNLALVGKILFGGKLLHKCGGVLFVHELLELLDVLLVLRDPLFQCEHIALEHGRLPEPLRIYLFSALGQKLQFVLHLLELLKVLLLHIRELSLYDVELLFIFLARLSEPVRELLGLRVVQLSVVLNVILLLRLSLLNHKD